MITEPHRFQHPILALAVHRRRVACRSRRAAGVHESRDRRANATLSTASAPDVDRAVRRRATRCVRADGLSSCRIDARITSTRLAPAQRSRRSCSVADRDARERQDAERSAAADPRRGRDLPATTRASARRWVRKSRRPGRLCVVHGVRADGCGRGDHALELPGEPCRGEVAPALAAGNAAILKPSEITTIVSLELGKLFVEAGLPAGLVNVLPGTCIDLRRSSAIPGST